MVLIDRDTDALQELACPRFRRISVHFREFALKMGDEKAFFVTHFGQRVDAITFLHHGPEFLVAHHHHIQYAIFLVRELVLRKLPDSSIGLDRNVAISGLQLSG